MSRLTRALDAFNSIDTPVSIRDRLEAALKAADSLPGLETPRMLVLSTSHISERTNDLFQMMADDVPLFFTKDTRGDPGDNVGWIIPIVGDEPFPHTCPEDLLAIRVLAETAGCTWIMLDRDADVVPNLPTYDW